MLTGFELLHWVFKKVRNAITIKLIKVERDRAKEVKQRRRFMH
jgi:hypothetical protein